MRAIYRSGRIVVDHRQASSDWDLDDDEQLVDAIVEAGGDAHWSDTDAIVSEKHDPKSSLASFLRYWLNIPTAAEDQPFTPAGVRALVVDDQIKPGEPCVLGFDGSRYDDSTALIACRLSDGLLDEISVWEKPEGPRGIGWEVKSPVVDFVVRQTLKSHRIVRFKADPPYWYDEVARWHGDHPDIVREFITQSPKTMGTAIDRFETAYRASTLKIARRATRLQAHLAHVREDKDRGYKRWRKATQAEKIDAGIAACIAYDTRGEVLSEGWSDEPEPASTLIRY